MVRSEPGAGDRDLLALLAARGRGDIGPSRLEAWRAAGLLAPTAVIRHNGHGSSSVLRAPVETVADQVEAISARTWRGRPVATSAVALTADGLVVGEDLLRQGHLQHIEKVRSSIDRFQATALAAWKGRAPRTVLERADAMASWLANQPGKPLTRWRRNLKHAGDVIVGSTVDVVLHSGLSAAVRLMLSGQGSDGGLYEFVTAQGLREFVLAMATGEQNPSLTVDEAAELIGPLVREAAVGGKGLLRLPEALEVPAEQLRAASAFVVELWAILAAVPSLSAAMKLCPSPTGDNPVMHSLAVAMLLRNTARAGIDVEPLVDGALTVGLLEAPAAVRMRAAASALAQIGPAHLRPSA